MLTLLAGNPAWPFGDVVAQVCWIMMVTGFAVVLYSRLNLILENLRLRKAILYMIIFNAVVWHTFMITLSFGRIKLGMEGKFATKEKWNKIYQPLERIHICFFNGQEILIACIYIHAAYQYLRSRFASDVQIRKAMYLLVGVQTIVVSLDLTIIILDFCGYLMLKLFINSFCYCIKLELEFIVLNQLVEMSKLGVAGEGFSLKTWDPEQQGGSSGAERKASADTAVGVDDATPKAKNTMSSTVSEEL